MADREFVEINIKKFIELIILGSIFVSPQTSLAYSTLSTHRAITNESAKIFNYYYPDKSLASDEVNSLIKGSADEDTPPRWLNHFYDPVHQIGFRGLRTSKDWAENTGAQAGWVSKNPLVEYFSSPNDYSWERAIYDYVYRDKGRALEALGHNLHLIQDTTVPDHTRDDAHPIWSTYESYAKQFEMANTNLADKLTSSKQAPIIFLSLSEYFDHLASFSNNNFFSDDTVLYPEYVEPKIIKKKEEKLKDGIFYNFGYNRLDLKIVEINEKLTRKGVLEEKYTISDPDNLIPSDSWLNLSPKAALASAGVIRLFFDEVEKEKQTKRLFEKNKSLADKFLDNLGKKVDNLLASVYASKPSLEIASSSPVVATTTLEVEGLMVPRLEPSTQDKIDVIAEAIRQLKIQLDYITANKEKGSAEDLIVATTVTLDGSRRGSPYSPDIEDLTRLATSSDSIIISPPTVISPADFSIIFSTSSITFSGTASSGLVIFNDFNRGQATTSETGEWVMVINNLPQGSSTIKFFVRDNGGNVSLPVEVNLVVDSLPLSLNFSINNCAQSLASNFCLLKPTSTLNFVWSPTKVGDYRYDLVETGNHYGTWLSPEVVTSGIMTGETSIGLNFGARDFLREFKWQIVARDASSSEIVASSSEIVTVFHPRPIVINEIGWAGTVASNLDEWFELRSYLIGYSVNLDDYYVSDVNETWAVNLSGSIEQESHYLVERGNDDIISNRAAQLVDNFIDDPSAKAFDPSSLGLKLWHKINSRDELVDETPVWDKTGSASSSLERTWESRVSTDLSTWRENEWCNKTDGPCALDRNATTTFGTPGVINMSSIPRLI